MERARGPKAGPGRHATTSLAPDGASQARLAALQRQAGNRAVAAAMVRIVQRKVGWTPETGEPGIPANPNAAETLVGSVRRVPLETGDLTTAGGNGNIDLPYTDEDTNHKVFTVTRQSAKDHAVALVPSGLTSGSNRVVLHFHGLGAGFRRKATTGAVRDEVAQLDRMEEQLASSAQNDTVIILPVGDRNASFGSIITKPFDYVDKVIEILKRDASVSTNRNGGVSLTGHSAGGNTISKEVPSESATAASPFQEIALFEGINNFVNSKTGRLAGRDKLDAYIDLCTKRITFDLAQLGTKSEPEQLGFLQSSFKFRAFYTGGFYVPVHHMLEQALKELFGEPVGQNELNEQKVLLGSPLGKAALTGVGGLSTPVKAALRANYQVIRIAQGGANHDSNLKAGKLDALNHDNMVGSGAMEQVLKERPTTASPTQPAPKVSEAGSDNGALLPAMAAGEAVGDTLEALARMMADMFGV